MPSQAKSSMENKFVDAILKEKVLASIMIAMGLFFSSIVVMYFSPYQSCARDVKKVQAKFEKDNSKSNWQNKQASKRAKRNLHSAIAKVCSGKD